MIRSVIANEDIYKGEEIFVHFNYPVKANSKVPKWYKQLYEEQVGPWPKNAKRKHKKVVSKWKV